MKISSTSQSKKPANQKRSEALLVLLLVVVPLLNAKRRTKNTGLAGRSDSLRAVMRFLRVICGVSRRRR
jgi:hypothetical protein